jgi:ADP-ribosylglycohydrolase
VDLPPEIKLTKILESVKEINSNSQSNGSLMRIAPMALFFALLEEDPANHANFIKSTSAPSKTRSV